MSGGAGKKHGLEGQGQGVLKVQQHQRLAHLPHPLHIHHLECIVQEGHTVKNMLISFQNPLFLSHLSHNFEEENFKDWTGQSLLLMGYMSSSKCKFGKSMNCPYKACILALSGGNP